MGNLDKLARQFGTDKGVGHEYTPFYERHLGPMQHSPIRLLEIGIYRGASIDMWDAWLKNPGARIVGVDIAPERIPIGPRITSTVVDVKEYTPDAPFDVIIDDGSHMGSDINAAFNRLWPYLTPNGWFVIEDLETMWEPVYEGGDHSPARVLLRGILEDVLRERSQHVAEMHCYRQIAFIRKNP